MTKNLTSKQKNPQEILAEYVSRKKLKFSHQRQEILGVLLASRKHHTAEEVFGLAKKKNSGIGNATVYRTLRLLCESGLCRELKCEDGIGRFEVQWGHEHHDHLICIKCGVFVEVVDPRIEKLQEELAAEEGFVLMRHRLELYGVCPECRRG